MLPELEPEVIVAIQNGRKIDAIKTLRELRGIGLKESKELIDAYCSINKINTPSVQTVKSGYGLIFFVVFCVLGYLLYRYFG